MIFFSVVWGISLSKSKASTIEYFALKMSPVQRTTQHFGSVLSEGQFVAERFKRVDSRGDIVWLEASYNPISDVHGRLYKVVKFATIITDQINRELAVSEAADIAFSTSQQTDNSAKKRQSGGQ